MERCGEVGVEPSGTEGQARVGGGARVLGRGRCCFGAVRFARDDFPRPNHAAAHVVVARRLAEAADVRDRDRALGRAVARLAADSRRVAVRERGREPVRRVGREPAVRHVGGRAEAAARAAARVVVRRARDEVLRREVLVAARREREVRLERRRARERPARAALMSAAPPAARQPEPRERNEDVCVCVRPKT